MEDTNSKLALSDTMEFFEGIPESQRRVPKTFMLMKYGKCPYTIDGEVGEFEFSPEDADAVINEFESRGKDLVVDYDHSTLNEKMSAQGNADAAGWIEGFVKGAEGLIAVVKNWTQEAYDKLMNGKYRYYSPVINFGDDGKAKCIHSVALTNHPALHGIPALVAANDTKSFAEGGKCPASGCIKKKENGKWGVISNKTGKFWSADYDTEDDAKKALAAYHINMNDIDEIEKALEETRITESAYKDALKSYAVLYSDNSDMSDRIKALTDSGSEVKAFADISAMIVDARNTMTGTEMLSWIEQKLLTTTAQDEIDQLNAERNRLNEFASKYPDLWNQGFTIADDRIVGMINENKEQSVYMNDIAKTLGLSDRAGKEQFQSKVKALCDYKVQAEKFLLSHEVKSFDDMTKKMIELKKATEDAKKDAEQKLLLSDAKIAVERELMSSTCRITEAQKPWAIDYCIKNGVSAFNDFLKISPPKFNKIPNEGELKKSQTETRKFSDEHIEFMKKAFGYSDKNKIEETLTKAFN